MGTNSKIEWTDLTAQADLGKGKPFQKQVAWFYTVFIHPFHNITIFFRAVAVLACRKDVSWSSFAPFRYRDNVIPGVSFFSTIGTFALEEHSQEIFTFWRHSLNALLSLIHKCFHSVTKFRIVGVMLTAFSVKTWLTCSSVLRDLLCRQPFFTSTTPFQFNRPHLSALAIAGAWGCSLMMARPTGCGQSIVSRCVFIELESWFPCFASSTSFQPSLNSGLVLFKAYTSFLSGNFHCSKFCLCHSFDLCRVFSPLDYITI